MNNKILNRGGGYKSQHFVCSAVKIAGNFNSLKKSKVKAFTLAEVLITLVIIGVVAALTIPNIVANYQKKQYVTQLKKTYTYLTKGFHTMMAQDGVTKLSDTNFWNKMSTTGTQVYETDLLNNANKGAKEEFLKIFSTAKILDGSTLPDNFRITYRALNYPSASVSSGSGMYLNDGAKISFNFSKTPNTSTCGDHPCSSLQEFQKVKNTPTKLWRRVGRITIDVNGPKTPNVWGRDLFSFWIDETGSLYPDCGVDYVSYSKCSYENLSSCERYWKVTTSESYNCSVTSQSYGYGCAARIMEENWQMNY